MYDEVVYQARMAKWNYPMQEPQIGTVLQKRIFMLASARIGEAFYWEFASASEPLALQNSRRVHLKVQRIFSNVETPGRV
jgi:hypothetical protein